MTWNITRSTTVGVSFDESKLGIQKEQVPTVITQLPIKEAVDISDDESDEDHMEPVLPAEPVDGRPVHARHPPHCYSEWVNLTWEVY